MWKEALSESKDAFLIQIEVVPNSKKSGLAGFDEWRKRLKVNVKAEAKEGKANKEVIGLFAELLGVSAKDVSIVSGQKSRQKTLAISGAGFDMVNAKLEGALGPQ